jgi:hypothetical protein
MPLAGSYLDVAGFEARTIAPNTLTSGAWIDPSGQFKNPLDAAKLTAWQTFVNSRLVIESSKIDSRLRKRYAVPFASPPPEIVCGWLVAMVTPWLYKRRGIDPSDAQFASVLQDAVDAVAEMTEAANSVDGLFDLPLLQTGTTSGVSQGFPLSYSETSPYRWTDVQADTAQFEDELD